jgi:hypothetical protein
MAMKLGRESPNLIQVGWPNAGEFMPTGQPVE